MTRCRLRLCALLLVGLLSSVCVASDCIAFSEAGQHVGKEKCVRGKVIKVTRLPSGTHFLNFCEDYRTCPFQVVIFRSDLKHVGDVRQLEGRIIEVRGEIKTYDGRPEILLKEARQLKGESARITPLPKNYDVEKKGRFSAGKFNHPKSERRPAPRPQGRPIETEDPESD